MAVKTTMWKLKPNVKYAAETSAEYSLLGEG